MKFRMRPVLAGVALAWAAASDAQSATSIALTVTSENTPGCHDAHVVSQRDVRDMASRALTAKGWSVVTNTDNAWRGIEAVIQVHYCQNVGGGQRVGYAANVGMYGVADGTTQVGNGKRVAFSYGGALVAFGGEERNGQLQKVRRDMEQQITTWVNKTF